MKAFISTDLEGLPYIVIPGHLGLKSSLHNEARKIAVKVTLIAIEELSKSGFNEIIVADSHGPMVNPLIDHLSEYVEIVRGYSSASKHVSEIEGCDVALFFGCQAKSGGEACKIFELLMHATAGTAYLFADRKQQMLTLRAAWLFFTGNLGFP